MKRFFTIVAALAAFAATAQTVVAAENDAEKKPHIQGFISNKFWDNWELQFGAGATSIVKSGGGFDKAISGAGYVAAGKWFHPVFGVRLGIQGGEYRYNSYNDVLCKTSFLYVHPDLMVDLSNWIGGYKADRLYSAIIYTGAGIVSCDLTKPKSRTLEYAFNAGLQNRFRIAEGWSIDLSLEYVLSHAVALPVRRLYKIESSRFNNVNVFLGATYKFNKRTFDRCGATEDEAKAMLARIKSAENDAAKFKAENAELNDKVAAQAKALDDAQALNNKQAEALKLLDERLQKCCKDCESVDNAGGAVSGGCHKGAIFFPIGQSALTASDKLQLDLIAEYINNSGKEVFHIDGFADPNTGTKGLNQRLSDKRAKNVYNYLVGKGVEKSRLEWKGNGQENCPFEGGKPASNRIVVIY